MSSPAAVMCLPLPGIYSEVPGLPWKRQSPELILSILNLTQRPSSLFSIIRPHNDYYNDFFPFFLDSFPFS